MLSAVMKFAKMGLAPNRIKVRWLWGMPGKDRKPNRTIIRNVGLMVIRYGDLMVMWVYSGLYITIVNQT